MGSIIADMPTLPCPPEEIQGNILKAFARDNAVYLFLRFAEGGPRVRSSLKRILDQYVISAARQDELSDAHKRSGGTAIVDGAGMFGLSASGYRRLGLSRSLPPDPSEDPTPFDEGLKNGQDYIWNASYASWEHSYSRSEIDAFLLLADDDPDRLAQSVHNAKAALAEIATVVTQETGHTLKDSAGFGYEHYGFREGTPKTIDPAGVLVPENGQGSHATGFGCFASFLKLEQNAAKLRDKCDELAGLFQGEPRAPNSRTVKEHSLGRTLTGDLLLPAGHDTGDQFTFDGVPESVCPFHAHVRVMRHSQSEPPFLFLRRGLSYGVKRPDIGNPDSTEDLPQTGSGLLFLSLQPTVWTFITLMGRAQRRHDALLSRSADIGAGQTWTFTEGGPAKQFPMADLTTIRGGEYFFIPSMNFLRQLA